VTTASETGVASDGDQAAADVLLLGAAGNSGRLIAADLAARGLSVRLAGRRRGPLEDLARAVAAAGTTAVGVGTVDVSDAASLAEAIAGVGLVLSTVGPFARQAGPVIDACLTAGVSYVDIANEWAAVRGLLDRGDQARAHAVTLVTGAGFGPAATETLVLRLVDQMGTVPGLVRVAAAAEVTHRSDGVRQTIQESLSHGVAVTYRDDQVVWEALGRGATVLTFGGAQRQMLPGPVGDLETARLASGAANVVAYIADPAAPSSGTGSYAWAEAVGPDGQTFTAELRAGEGVRATAAIAAETARRVLAGARPGAWTPGQLFGADLVTDATGAEVAVSGQPALPGRCSGGN
jgi:saccharopine dehydrogenase (NAD+, L-lysine-forming)